MKRDYIKPEVEYWHADELNCIEAKMSNSGGYLWWPEIISATYDGETATVRYKVNQANDGNWQIGYEYAYDANDDLFGVYNIDHGAYIASTVGEYTVKFPIKNYCCQIRLFIRVVSGGNVSTVYKDSSNLLMYLPKDIVTSEYVITSIDVITWKIYDSALSIIADAATGTLKFVIDVADTIVQILSLNPTSWPEPSVGQYYHSTTSFTNNAININVKIWNNKQEYLENKNAIFDETFSKPVAMF